MRAIPNEILRPLAFAALLFGAMPVVADEPTKAPAPKPLLSPQTGLPSFPKENPAQLFTALKIFDANGSPIRKPIEDWEAARQRVATDPSWQKWLAAQRADVDDWMQKRHDKTEWVTGWEHDFVSPKDGSFLTFTPDEPGEATLSSSSDPKVKLTPKLHAAWVCFFRERHAEKMVAAARLYRLTGDTRYAEWAAAQIDFYADNLDQWPAHGSVRIMWQSLDEAVILIRWLDAARELGDFVTPARKQRWCETLFTPEARSLETSYQTIHNIACWQRSAVGQVALYCHDDALWKSAVDGEFGIRNQIKLGITGDYLWYEQSLHYNNYVVRALAPFFEYAMMAGRGASLQTEMESLEDLMLSPLRMYFPDGQLPNPADGAKPGFAPTPEVLKKSHAPGVNEDDPHFLAWFARLFPTKLGVNLASQEKNWDTLIDPLAPSPAGELPVVTSLNLESSRMAIIRSGPWQVYFHYGQLAASHSQAEALNFEAFYNQTDVTHDPGTPGYGSPLTGQYYKTGLAHNVPLVDGVGQVRWNPGKLENFSPTSVTAGQPDYRTNAQAVRSLKIAGDSLRDEVSIKTTDGKEHALGFMLNLQGKVKLPPEFVAETKFMSLSPVAGFKLWRDARSAKFHDHATLDVQFRGMTLRVKLDLPGDFTLYTGSVPDYPPARRQGIYLETRGQSAILKTTFSPVAAHAPGK